MKSDKRGNQFYVMSDVFSRYCVKLTILWPGFCRPAEIRTINGLLDFLCDEIRGTFSKVVFDNYYMSPKTAEHMITKGLYNFVHVNRTRFSHWTIFRLNFQLEIMNVMKEFIRTIIMGL